MKRSLPPLAALAALLFWGCPTTSNQDNLDYLRSPVTFRVDTVATAHPYCNTVQTGYSADSCRAVKKYALRWERPQDTSGFLEYRIYLDTNPPGAGDRTWDQVRGDPTFASAIIPGAGGATDSLILVFSRSGFHSVVVQRGASQIVSIDTSGRLDDEGRFVFAIVAAYRGGSNGQPRYTWVITNDQFPPFPLQLLLTPYERSVQIQWERPLDPTSFFDPGADSGMIRHYVLKIVRSGLLNATRNTPFNPRVHFENGGLDRSDRVVSDSFTTSKGAPGYHFILPDSLRIFNSRTPDPRDSLKAVVSGLTPMDTVDISVWAVDASGNFTDTVLYARKILTDTTEPVMPRLRLLSGSVTRNQFAYGFTASRDLVPRNGVLAPADSPNANIKEYHVTRRRLSGSTGGTANKDTIFTVARRSDTLFVDTVRYLPPGATYRIFAQAMDSTGHLSQQDSLDISTLPVTFPVATSTCPAGFIPIPAGSFRLGDVSNNDPDELPLKSRSIKSYCIENYEHLDNSSGLFQTRVTWQQAQKICRNISPSDSTHLCTEAEWERACEGTDAVPLVYGFQSASTANPNAVLGACNIGTGDSIMAFTPGLRNPTCLNREGVFDMSGNLAEWVLDPYSATAYNNPDTLLYPGKTLVPQVDTAVHGYRGGYYLNGHVPATTLLKQARCSNRDFPTQVRPRAYKGCLDSIRPQIVLLYRNAQGVAIAPRCLPMPDSLIGRNVTSVSTDRDSTRILFLIDGVPAPVKYTLPVDPSDTTYTRLRAYSAGFTTRTLAVVAFENSETSDVLSDTLDATEMIDTSDASLSVIFNREVSPPWSARKTGGRYAIRFLYAYSQLHNVPARRQYSNAAIGFRCCSLPRP